jgi:hypothetical protein
MARLVGDWLVGQYMVLGVIPFQNWMLIPLAIIVVWVTFTWLARSALRRDSFYVFFAVAWLVIMIGWLLFVTFAE